MFRKKILTGDIRRLTRKGLSADDIAKKVKYTPQAVRVCCNKLFGKSVIKKDRRITNLQGQFVKRLRQSLSHKHAPILMWAVKEALRRDLEVSLPLTKERPRKPVFFVNNRKVEIKVTMRPSHVGRSVYMYRWGMGFPSDCSHYMLIAMMGAYAHHCVILPHKKVRGKCIYFPVNGSIKNIREKNNPLLQYEDRWRF